MGNLLPLSITRRIYFNYSLFKITYKNKVLCQKFVFQCQLTCLFTLFTSNLSHLPPLPPPPLTIHILLPHFVHQLTFTVHTQPLILYLSSRHLTPIPQPPLPGYMGIDNYLPPPPPVTPPLSILFGIQCQPLSKQSDKLFLQSSELGLSNPSPAGECVPPRFWGEGNTR